MENDRATVIRCVCGNIICVRDPHTDEITVKKHGRQVRIVSPYHRVVISCERCGNETAMSSESKENKK